MIRKRILPVVWIVTTVLFIGFVPLIGADVNAASNENDWMPTNGPYGGHIYTLYATPEGVLFAGVSGAGVFRSTNLGDSWTPVNVGLPFERGKVISLPQFLHRRVGPSTLAVSDSMRQLTVGTRGTTFRLSKRICRLVVL